MTDTDTLIITIEVPEVDVVAATATVDVAPSTGPPPVILVAQPGPPGPRGFPGTGVPITREIPTGAIDGINVSFTTLNQFQPGTTCVFLNGLLEIYYTESGTDTVVFSEPPLDGDVIAINYVVQ